MAELGPPQLDALEQVPIPPAEPAPEIPAAPAEDADIGRADRVGEFAIAEVVMAEVPGVLGMEGGRARVERLDRMYDFLPIHMTPEEAEHFEGSPRIFGNMGDKTLKTVFDHLAQHPYGRQYMSQNWEFRGDPESIFYKDAGGQSLGARATGSAVAWTFPRSKGAYDFLMEAFDTADSMIDRWADIVIREAASSYSQLRLLQDALVTGPIAANVIIEMDYKEQKVVLYFENDTGRTDILKAFPLAAQFVQDICEKGNRAAKAMSRAVGHPIILKLAVRLAQIPQLTSCVFLSLPPRNPGTMEIGPTSAGPDLLSSAEQIEDFVTMVRNFRLHDPNLAPKTPRKPKIRSDNVHISWPVWDLEGNPKEQSVYEDRRQLQDLIQHATKKQLEMVEDGDRILAAEAVSKRLTSPIAVAAARRAEQKDKLTVQRLEYAEAAASGQQAIVEELAKMQAEGSSAEECMARMGELQLELTQRLRPIRLRVEQGIV